MKKLSTLRQQIDSIDQKLVELLNKRTEITSSIGKIKVKNGLSIFASERERGRSNGYFEHRDQLQ